MNDPDIEPPEERLTHQVTHTIDGQRAYWFTIADRAGAVRIRVFERGSVLADTTARLPWAKEDVDA